MKENINRSRWAEWPMKNSHVYWEFVTPADSFELNDRLTWRLRRLTILLNTLKIPNPNIGADTDNHPITYGFTESVPTKKKKKKKAGIWHCVYRASYCNVLMTNEMHSSYNRFYSAVFCLLYMFRTNLVVHHQEHGIIYCITQFGTIVLSGESGC